LQNHGKMKRLSQNEYKYTKSSSQFDNRATRTPKQRFINLGGCLAAPHARHSPDAAARGVSILSAASIAALCVPG
jgi:hypothetical protein